MIKYFLIIKYKLKLQTKYKQKLFVLNEKQIIYLKIIKRLFKDYLKIIQRLFKDYLKII